MTELQTGLMLLGGVAVGSIVAVSIWENLQHLRAYQNRNNEPHSDTSTGLTADDTSQSFFTQTISNDILTDHDKPFTSQASMIERVIPSHLDSILDDIILIETKKTIIHSQIMILHSQLQKISSLISLYLWNSQTEEWMVIPQDHHDAPPIYKVCCSTQLITRQETMTSQKITQCRTYLREFSGQYDGRVHYHTSSDVSERIQQLEKLLHQVDVDIVLTIIAKKNCLPGKKVCSIAKEFGCRLDKDGRFHLPTQHPSKNIFYITTLDNEMFDQESLLHQHYEGVRLLMEMTLSYNPLESFIKMKTLAQRLASSCQGIIVDDNGQEITNTSFESIRHSVIQLNKSMGTLGIVPGSGLASRICQPSFIT